MSLPKLELTDAFKNLGIDLPDPDLFLAPGMPVEESIKPVALEIRAALEDIPHLLDKVLAIWGTPELDTLLRSIALDSRDGERQGLPFAVGEELMFLARINKIIRAMATAPKLGISIEEAMALVEEGDLARIGLTGDMPFQMGR